MSVIQKPVDGRRKTCGEKLSRGINDGGQCFVVILRVREHLLRREKKRGRRAQMQEPLPPLSPGAAGEGAHRGGVRKGIFIGCPLGPPAAQPGDGFIRSVVFKVSARRREPPHPVFFGGDGGVVKEGTGNENSDGGDFVALREVRRRGGGHDDRNVFEFRVGPGDAHR